MADKKIKILFIIGSMGHGRAGTEKNLLTILENLDRRKFEPYLISLQDCEYLQAEKFVCDTKCLHLYRMFTPTMFRARKLLAEQIKEMQIDIVQTFFIEAHIVGGGAAKIAGVKNIISSRRNMGYAYTLKEKIMLKYANRYPTQYLANCKAIIDEISRVEGTNPDKYDVIYNGIDPFTDSDLQTEKAKQTIVMTANLRPVKSITTLVKAAKIVSDKYPNVKFQLLGDGSDRQQVESLINQLNLNNNIQLLGSQKDIRSFLVKATIGVLTSKSEGCSNAILEYMHAGLPVVVTDVGGNRELVKDGESGYLVPIRDYKKLAEMIIRLLDNPQQAQEMGQAGLEIARAYFSLNAMINAYQEYYSNLTK